MNRFNDYNNVKFIFNRQTKQLCAPLNDRAHCTLRVVVGCFQCRMLYMLLLLLYDTLRYEHRGEREKTTKFEVEKTEDY